MDYNSKPNTRKQRRASVLEALKELGDTTEKSFRNDLVKEGSKDFVSQLFGTQQTSADRHISGELLPQEGVRIESILSGNSDKEEQLQRQLALERRLREEEKALFERKSQELKLALYAVTEELKALASVTPKLAHEVQVAVIQAPANPGIYHVIFFEKLLEYIKGFRKKIEDASVWLHAVNKRAAKKGFWAQYKKHGGRRLLSAEDYSQRSAG